MSKPVDIADALVTVLAANGFSEARVAYLPVLDREDCGTRQVLVIPKQDDLNDGTRDDGDRVIGLSLVIQQAVDIADTDTIATLIDAREDLIELYQESGPLRHVYLEDGTLTSGPTSPKGVIYDPEHLLEMHIFTAVLAVEYTIEGD